MRNIRRKSLPDENSAAYVKLVCFFAFGCILGVIVARILPYSAANSAISKILNYAQQSKIIIWLGIFLKAIVVPTLIVAISYLGFLRAIPFVFCLMGAAIACTSSLCAIAAGAGGYFASMICNAAINFTSLLGALIMGAIALNAPRRRAKYEIAEQTGAVYIAICVFMLVFSIIASVVSSLFINSAIYLIK